MLTEAKRGRISMIEFDKEIEEVGRLRELLPLDEGTITALKIIGNIYGIAKQLITLQPFIVVSTKDAIDITDVSPTG